MSLPVNKIETLTGETSDYIIENAANSIYTKEVITDGIGHFKFVLPTKKNGTYDYGDIALNDKVKIWFGYGSVGVTPNFVGKVGKISAPLSVSGGYVRMISGFSQGEVLLRRFKKDKLWTGIGVSTIVTELANDLGLGLVMDTPPDTTPITYEVETKTYFDILRNISDYWVSAGSQIKKDFYVNVDNALVWKARPLRTAGVETLTVAQNIYNYVVNRSIEPAKNNMVQYGAKERTEPADPDSWSESLANWTALSGALALIDVGERKGIYCVRCKIDTGTIVSFYKSHSKLKNYDKLVFWAVRGSVTKTSAYVRILAPDTSNYFQANMNDSNSPDWTLNSLLLGPNSEYNADSNPTGVWTKVGSPRWYNLMGVWFYHVGSDPASWFIDGDFAYLLGRYSGVASDLDGAGSSGVLYGQRDLETTDDKLHSDSDCTKRAETLLYQLKTPPIQLDITIPGNTNMLVGDRLSISIPAEGITAQPYDVFNVEHTFAYRGEKDPTFDTKATMVNSVNIREAIVMDPIQETRALLRQMRQFGLGEIRRG